MKSPQELYEQLKETVAACERDASKAERGMKAGGVRLRATMNEIRQLALEIRKSVLTFRKPTKKRQGASEPPEKLPVPELTRSSREEPVPAQGAQTFWYSNFAY